MMRALILLSKFWKRFKLNNKLKIICTGYHRTGTKSLGDFIEQYSGPRATWRHSEKNNWTKHALLGDFKSIIESNDFSQNTVFEDSPFFNLAFIKYYFHYNPSAVFINVERDCNEWFDSLMRHSQGKTLGSGLWFLYNYGFFDELTLLNKGINFSEIHRLKFELSLLKRQIIQKYESDRIERRLFFDLVDPDRKRSIFLNHKNRNSWTHLSQFLTEKVGLDEVTNPIVTHRHKGVQLVETIVKNNYDK